MAATITTVPDGNFNMGSKNAQLVTLKDSAAAYPTGGYLFVTGEAVGNGASPTTQNCGLWRIDTIQPWGGQGGYVPVWNPTTSKLQIFQGGAAVSSPLAEVPANTDLSALTFLLALIGL